MKLLKAILNYFKNVDLYLLFLSLICSAYGLVLIYSATLSYQSNKFMIVQGAAIGLGFCAFIIFSLIDLDNLSDIWKVFFVLNLLLLGSLYFLGVSGDSGNKSWIRFLGIGIQPAEIGKLLFAFTFAKHTSLLRDRLNNWKSLLQLFLHLGIVCAFIVLISADAGMALAYVFMCIVILFVGGLSMKWFAGGLALCIAFVPILWNLFLKAYQKTRILILFDPSLDPDMAYQATQSKIALGAGQIFGTGYMEGKQTQYGMLPAKHTDFIFSVAGEEFGMIGCLIIVGLLSLLILRVFYVSYRADSIFSTLFCAGIGGMFLFQTFLNILMCLGIMPVIGLTLPFFSYGGSSVVTMFAAVGAVAGIRMRSKPTWLR